jgi:hypothetical protein
VNRVNRLVVLLDQEGACFLRFLGGLGTSGAFGGD